MRQGAGLVCLALLSHTMHTIGCRAGSNRVELASRRRQGDGGAGS